MMGKSTFLRLMCTATVALMCAAIASAFNPNNYATQSRLSTGKWVKISIPESGVYEITGEELQAMGFDDPSRVRLYGQGGILIPEYLNGKAVDDLAPVPVLRVGDKIIFYGNGPIRLTLTGYNNVPRFQREFNPYSQVGCYFLTEESSTELRVTRRSDMAVNNSVPTSTCLNCFYHEKELLSLASSGKEMMGEEFTNHPLFVDYYLPDLADSTIVVNTAVGAYCNATSNICGVIHSDGGIDSTHYTASSSRLLRPGKDVVYTHATPYGYVKISHPAEHGQFEPYIKCPDSVSRDTAFQYTHLDYFILTYKRRNIIREGENGQLFMGYAATRGNERYLLPGATPGTVVWLLNDTYAPKEVPLMTYDDETGSGYYFYSAASNYSYFVAFDPAQTLKKVCDFEPVANQNLHALSTPELLIITDKMYHEQAERVAQLHRAVDGIDVAVVDQDQVFNEFSSGTRDAMAYRLLAKMLYDRNPSKLKNLLLFGTGSVDNRELHGKHDGQLLTYQSDNSNNPDLTFSSDDFFVFLNDNSGTNVASEKMTIGVGRMVCTSVEEARSDVDKLVEYYATPDYGVWRNNTLVVSDSPDKGEYLFQGEGYRNLIDNELNTGMHANTVHNSQYPRSSTETDAEVVRKTAVTGKKLLKQFFKSGVYFGTYVGHAGTAGFTKYSHMWVISDVAGTSYKHLPILTTACCDVAPFDHGVCGVAELMYHKRDGGAIALFTTNRMVVSDGNDRLNRFFLNNMFDSGNVVGQQTLGEICKNSKNNFPAVDTNKMKFFLLGDPAIKVNYPVTRFNITQVNGTDMTDSLNKAEISPLMKFDIVAQVVDEEGNLDNSFNGDATATLYDKQLYFTTITRPVDGETIDRDIYFNRAKLAEVSGKVVNGIFTGQMIAPRKPRAVNNDVLLRVYAHKDNSSYMVNGFTYQVKMLPYNDSVAIIDDEAPVISAMFINDEAAFNSGAAVATDAMLYINVADNEGFNTQSNAIDDCMTLVLDGGKTSCSDVSAYATATDGGHDLSIAYPLKNLVGGLHTLTYTVYDVAGNVAARTISFMVGQGSRATLVADKWPAYRDGTVTFDLETDISFTPVVTIHVTDATGKLVWKTSADSFPVTWNMQDMDGNRVPAGLYRYYGTYDNGTDFGGTPISRLIVIDPLKTLPQKN